jgi:hypothetical protein
MRSVDCCRGKLLLLDTAAPTPPQLRRGVAYMGAYQCCYLPIQAFVHNNGPYNNSP